MKLEKISAILIWSEDWRKLADWYIEKLGLVTEREIHHPNDTGVNFKVGNMVLWIGQHDKVHGKNPDPYRHMYNFMVDSVTETYEELKKRGVEFFAEPFKSFTSDRYFATFYDLDGNMVQLHGEK